ILGAQYFIQTSIQKLHNWKIKLSIGDCLMSELLFELLLVLLDLGSDVGGKAGLDGGDLLVLGLQVLVGAEDLDDVSGGLLGVSGELGDSGAGLIGVGLDVVGELLELGDEFLGHYWF
ncbi:hypothetical protein PENTCL1PPCAC_1039, partial [Pristionchus entomophagus]